MCNTSCWINCCLAEKIKFELLNQKGAPFNSCPWNCLRACLCSSEINANWYQLARQWHFISGQDKHLFSWMFARWGKCVLLWLYWRKAIVDQLSSNYLDYYSTFLLPVYWDEDTYHTFHEYALFHLSCLYIVCDLVQRWEYKEQSTIATYWFLYL